MTVLMTLMVGLFLLFPGGAFADTVATTATSNFLVSCATSGDCNTCDFVAQFLVIAETLLKTLSAVSIIAIMYGGLLWILSTGNTERVRKGKQVLIGTGVGILIVFSAYLIVNFTLRAFIGDDFTGQLFGRNWGAICKGQVGLGSETTPNQTSNGTVGADEELDNSLPTDDECATLPASSPCETASCPDESVCFCHNSTCKEICLATVDQLCTDAESDCTDPVDDGGIGGEQGDGECLYGGFCCLGRE